MNATNQKDKTGDERGGDDDGGGREIEAAAEKVR